MTEDDAKTGVSPHEAAAALREVEKAGRRSQALGLSAAMGPQLMVWGLVWFVCNTVCQFGPPWAPAVWFPGVVTGVGASIVLTRRAGAPFDGRRAGTMAVLFAFVNVVCLAFNLRDPAQQNLMVSLVVAVAYTIFGLWRSERLAWVGVVLGLLTVIGWWAVRPWFEVWMGVVGGGALFLTGFWMRRA